MGKKIKWSFRPCFDSWQKWTYCPTSWCRTERKQFVPPEYSKITLENIKGACKAHYRENLTTCNILASEQEPSFFSVGSNSKLQSHVCLLYHTRVWKVHPFRNVRIRSISKPATTQKIPEECYFTRCCISSQHNEKYSVFCGTKKPFSSRYVQIWEDHQTCRKQNFQCWGWRIWYRE